MILHPRIVGFSEEQNDLWARVHHLWSISLDRNPDEVRATIHPNYVGWDMSSAEPHDREVAVQSVTGDSPLVTEYELHPHSVKVYEHSVGIVHYSYTATVVPRRSQPQAVSGKWTETYLKQGDTWLLISVSGRPDPATP